MPSRPPIRSVRNRCRGGLLKYIPYARPLFLQASIKPVRTELERVARLGALGVAREVRDEEVERRGPINPSISSKLPSLARKNRKEIHRRSAESERSICACLPPFQKRKRQCSPNRHRRLRRSSLLISLSGAPSASPKTPQNADYKF